MSGGFGSGLKTAGGCLTGCLLFVLFYVVVVLVAAFIMRGLGIEPDSIWAGLVLLLALFLCFIAVERITGKRF